MAKRFSKDAVIDALEKQAKFLQEKWDFTARTGTAQLRDSDSTDRKVAYGEWNSLRNLVMQIDEGWLINDD